MVMFILRATEYAQSHSELRLYCDPFVLAVIGDTVFAGTDYIDIWKRSLSEFISVTPGYQDLQVNVYPNPFDKSIDFVEEDSLPSRVILYDILSRKLLEKNFIGSTTLYTSQLAKGFYLYEVINANGKIKAGKVIKK